MIFKTAVLTGIGTLLGVLGFHHWVLVTQLEHVKRQHDELVGQINHLLCDA